LKLGILNFGAEALGIEGKIRRERLVTRRQCQTEPERQHPGQARLGPQRFTQRLQLGQRGLCRQEVLGGLAQEAVVILRQGLNGRAGETLASVQKPNESRVDDLRSRVAELPVAG
jgi:hypothetical protein